MAALCSVTIVNGTMTTVEDIFIRYDTEDDDDEPKLVLTFDEATPPLGINEVRRLRDALNLWLAEHGG